VEESKGQKKFTGSKLNELYYIYIHPQHHEFPYINNSESYMYFSLILVEKMLFKKSILLQFESKEHPFSFVWTFIIFSNNYIYNG